LAEGAGDELDAGRRSALTFEIRSYASRNSRQIIFLGPPWRVTTLQGSVNLCSKSQSGLRLKRDQFTFLERLRTAYGNAISGIEADREGVMITIGCGKLD
jgi:hypothetical protein